MRELLTVAFAFALQNHDVLGPVLVEKNRTVIEPLEQVPERARDLAARLAGRQRLITAQRIVAYCDGESERMLPLAVPGAGRLVASWPEGRSGVLPVVDAVAFVAADGSTTEVEFPIVEETLSRTPALSRWSPADELFKVVGGWFPTPALLRFMRARAAVRTDWRMVSASSMLPGLRSGEAVVTHVESRMQVELSSADGRRSYAPAGEVRQHLSGDRAESLRFLRLLALAELAQAVLSGRPPDLSDVRDELRGQGLEAEGRLLLPSLAPTGAVPAGALTRPLGSGLVVSLREQGPELALLDFVEGDGPGERLWSAAMTNLRAGSRAPQQVFEFAGWCSPTWEDGVDASRVLLPEVLNAIRPLSGCVVVTLRLTDVLLVDRADPRAFEEALAHMEAVVADGEDGLLLTAHPWIFDEAGAPRAWDIPGDQLWSPRLAALIELVAKRRAEASR